MHTPFPSIAAIALLGVAATSCASAPSAIPLATRECETAISPTGRTVDITWLPTNRSSTGSALDAWCSGVGPAVVASGATAEATAVEHLAIVSWNVHVGGGDVPRLVRELQSGTLTFGRPVRNFVLLLQEVHRSGPAVPPLPSRATYPDRITETPPSGERIDVVETARRLDLHVFYAPSMRNGDGSPGEDRGNAILSTLPLTDATAIELPYEAQRRVTVASTISGTSSDGDVWRLRLASTHLDNRTRLSRILDSFGPARTRQATALARTLTGEAVVIGGDLNTWSAGFLEQAPGVLRAHFPNMADDEVGPTFTAGFLPLRLDHLFSRLPDGWSGEVQRIEDRYGSDHYPLLAIIRIAPPVERTSG